MTKHELHREPSYPVKKPADTLSRKKAGGHAINLVKSWLAFANLPPSLEFHK
jgi:hypothetical protein